MSERDLRRVEILGRFDLGGLTTNEAAGLLDLSRRQVFRLLRRFRAEGPSSIAPRSRGRPPNNRTQDAVRRYALDLVREHFADFGPTLAAEALAERHGLKVSRETLRGWMIEDGIWLSRRQRKTFHQSRLRRERRGELIEIDGSEHRWFEDRTPTCSLLVFIDDATGELMQLRFEPAESTFAYFEALELYLQAHGRPVAFYSDKHSVFRVAKQGAKSGHGMTQFGRALSELNIEILCANSSQAKGRVERANRTLQDRLVKELRLESISSTEAANAFIPGFMARFNRRFARAPQRADDLHRPLNMEPDRLREILCLRDERYVSRQLSLSYERRLIMLEQTELTAGLAGKYVDTYEYPDGRLEIRRRGVPLGAIARSTRTSG